MDKQYRSLQAPIVALLVMCFFIPMTVHARAETPGVVSYQLGVFPFLPPRELEKIFAPFAASIGKALGSEVLFQSSASYRNFMSRSDAEVYDIAFVQPFDYIRLADKHHYFPLATRGEKLATVFATREDSPIMRVEDLKGKIIAMPPVVAAVSRLAHSYLSELGFVEGVNIKFTYHRSHASCLQQVLIGSADVCATASPPIRFMEQKMKTKFKIITQTTEIPHTLFVAHRRIPEHLRKKILETILSWTVSEEGRRMLERGRMTPFVKIEDRDYDIVRKMIGANKKH